MSRAHGFLTPLVVVLGLVAPAGASTTRAAARNPADFTGVLLRGPGAAAVPLTLHVDSFTSAREVGRLSRLLGDRAPRRVAAALAAIRPRGWVEVGGLVDCEVPVIREFATDRGPRIFAVLDNPSPLWDRLHLTRPPDAPFGLLELRLSLDGNGRGTLVGAGRALFTKDGKAEIVSYGSRPHPIIGVAQQPAG